MEVFAILCDRGSAAYWKSPTDSCHLFCTPGNPCATSIVTRGEGSFHHEGVSTGGVRHAPVQEKYSASPKPHPSKPRPCNMPQAKTEVALQFSECCAAETALQHWLFCNAEVIWTKSCTAANEKLHCNIEKAALQESGAFLRVSSPHV